MFFTKCIFLAILIMNVKGSTLRKDRSDFRIVGGRSIDITQAPYQVSVLTQGRHNCGGTIIDKNIIITAAHCVSGFKVTDLHIRAGSTLSSHGGQVIPVGDFIWHQDFSFSSLNSDIAILWLQWPLTGNDAVRSVMMMEDGEEIPDGGVTVVTGWGRTAEDGNSATTLQSMKVPIVNGQVCSAIYRSFNGISSRMLCAGYPEGGKSSCKGDSGGPMIYNGKLAGVVSWGIGCARPGYPGVYAKVSALRKWLDYNISLLIQKYSTSVYGD